MKKMSLLMAGLTVMLGVGVVAYRRLKQPPAEILDFLQKNPDHPRPELVGWGLSPSLVVLLIGVAVVAIAGVLAAWRWFSH
jgi:hypothetical protein